MAQPAAAAAAPAGTINVSSGSIDAMLAQIKAKAAAEQEALRR
eukprot:SAG22_NODE_188_length_15821_cov_38.313319_14_plen_43_part_00